MYSGSQHVMAVLPLGPMHLSQVAIKHDYQQSGLVILRTLMCERHIVSLSTHPSEDRNSCCKAEPCAITAMNVVLP